jgi:hypothetical protein
MSRVRDLMGRLEEMPSQMPEADDEAWWNRLIQDRLDAVDEIRRLARSRNRWAEKYNKLREKSQ